MGSRCVRLFEPVALSGQATEARLNRCLQFVILARIALRHDTPISIKKRTLLSSIPVPPSIVFHPVSVNLHRPFYFGEIAQPALFKAHLGLLSIERIEVTIDRFSQRRDVSRRVE